MASKNTSENAGETANVTGTGNTSCGCFLDKSSIFAITAASLIIAAGILLNNCDPPIRRDLSLELSQKVLSQWHTTLSLDGKQAFISKTRFRLGLNVNNEFPKTVGAITKILKEEQDILGQDEFSDPSDLILAMHVYVNSLMSLGDSLPSGESQLLSYTEALNVSLELLELQGLAIGLGHHDCYELRNKIGHLYELLGDFDQAITFWLYVKEYRGRVLGMDHKDTFEAQRRIGVAMMADGKVDMAHMELHQAYSGLEENYGAEHVKTLQIQRDIAHVLHAKGSKTKALSNLRELLQKQIKVLGEEHADTVLTRESLAKLN